MKQWINPVYGKELRLRVRSVKFALMVMFYNLILIIIAMFGFSIMFNIQVNTIIDYSNAVALYAVLISIEALMAMFLVPKFTAGSIAGEREKQTLEILLTTVMEPKQIIFGKLLSSISMILLLIISSIPALSIVFTVGGIGLGSLLQFIVVVCVFSIFFGSMGMFASALIKRSVAATVFTYAEILISGFGTGIIVVITYVLANIYYETTLGGTGAQPDISIVLLLFLLNPGITMIELLFKQYEADSFISTLVWGFNGNNGTIWNFITEHWIGISLICQLAASYLFILLAARCLDPLRKHRSKSKKTK